MYVNSLNSNNRILRNEMRLLSVSNPNDEFIIVSQKCQELAKSEQEVLFCFDIHADFSFDNNVKLSFAFTVVYKQ